MQNIKKTVMTTDPFSWHAKKTNH